VNETQRYTKEVGTKTVIGLSALVCMAGVAFASSAEPIRLEYAVAKDVAALLNDLIGNDVAKKDQPAAVTCAGSDGTAMTLAEAAANRRAQTATNVSIISDASKSLARQLSRDNIRILADERANVLLVMASHDDMTVIKDVVAQVDIRRPQVLIEAVVVEINFGSAKETGVEWVQRTLGGDSGSSLRTASAFLTFPSQDYDKVVNAITTEDAVRVISSPCLMTQDGTEVILEAMPMSFYRPRNHVPDNTDLKDVNLTLKVTPHINKKGYIVLAIEGTHVATVSAPMGTPDGYPAVATRRVGADIAMQGGETVALGGFVRSSTEKVMTRVPVLGRIPLLGRLFRSQKAIELRKEIVVFLTPRVIEDVE